MPNQRSVNKLNNRESARGLLLWLLLSGTLLWLSWSIAEHSVRQSVSEQLASQLLPTIIAAKGFRIGQYEGDDELLARINNDIRQPQIHAVIPLIKQCRLQLQALHGQPQPASGADQIILSRDTTEGRQEFAFDFDCQPDYPLWLGSQMVIALLLTLLMLWLPRPLSQAERNWQQKIARHHPQQASDRSITRQLLQLKDNARAVMEELLQQPACSLDKALTIAHELNHSGARAELPWLLKALENQHLQPTEAAHIACAPATLEFQPQQQTVIIHGVAVRMPLTPFLYYFWYAAIRLNGQHSEPHREQQNEGWFTNPPTNRPDHEQGRRLSELMKRYGGHGKAINDLESNGLKAKTLDQNRSKIKDELVSAVGEELAYPYLFETERDSASGRSKYRIRLPGKAIKGVGKV